MGQKESKLQPVGGVGSRSGELAAGSSGQSSSTRHGRQASNRNRLSRADISGILQSGIPSGSGQTQDPPYERRETRQEREARKKERERQLREKERERSIKEEHVDGGYLVTLGTYVGPEDFSKTAVRQFQIERKLAPFWRGLNDVDPTWTEHQIIAAARGLEIPKADEPPPENLIPKLRPPLSPTAASGSSLQKLTVPMGPRSLSQASDQSGSNPTSSLPSPHMASVKAKGKALATALKSSSRNASQTEVNPPREINLPYDPYVNGQPVEVFLYKEPQDCPICFLSYPPYLNRTRCCDQPICSECFVQIKRPDPHHPDHHGDAPGAPPEPGAESQLISEPAQCPYCQTPELGVTYDPPPFRRGLAYPLPTPMSGSGNASSSSLGGSGVPSSPPATSRRRAQSLAANAPGVITTDKVRPDWFAKLEAQRSHQARRAAAATALHTATFLMGGTEGRSLFGRASRMSRRQAAASAVPSSTNEANASNVSTPSARSQPSPAPEPGPRGIAGPRTSFFDARRVEDLEELMMAEAVRLSLADEEERKRKAAKEAKKESKKNGDKEDARQSGKTQESSGSGASDAADEGRRRGNSGSSNLRIEASLANAANAEATSNKALTNADKGKAVERPPSSDGSEAASSATVGSLPIPGAGNHHARAPSHLRQMSNASSVSSSVAGSAPGSYTRQDSGDPRSSSISVGDDGQAEGGSTPNEPMFNFRSLAEMVGVSIEGEEDDDGVKKEKEEAYGTPASASPAGEPSTAATEDHSSPHTSSRPSGELRSDMNGKSHPPPEVTVTPTTPAPDDTDDDSKQLGSKGTVLSRHVEVTQ